MHCINKGIESSCVDVKRVHSGGRKKTKQESNNSNTNNTEEKNEDPQLFIYVNPVEQFKKHTPKEQQAMQYSFQISPQTSNIQQQQQQHQINNIEQQQLLQQQLLQQQLLQQQLLLQQQIPPYIPVIPPEQPQFELLQPLQPVFHNSYIPPSLQQQSIPIPIIQHDIPTDPSFALLPQVSYSYPSSSSPFPSSSFSPNADLSPEVPLYSLDSLLQQDAPSFISSSSLSCSSSSSSTSSPPYLSLSPLSAIDSPSGDFAISSITPLSPSSVFDISGDSNGVFEGESEKKEKNGEIEVMAKEIAELKQCVAALQNKQKKQRTILSAEVFIYYYYYTSLSFHLFCSIINNCITACIFKYCI